MIKMTYNGQKGYFIPEDQKKELDKILLPLFKKCGDACNENQLSL